MDTTNALFILLVDIKIHLQDRYVYLPCKLIRLQDGYLHQLYIYLEVLVVTTNLGGVLLKKNYQENLGG